VQEKSYLWMMNLRAASYHDAANDFQVDTQWRERRVDRAGDHGAECAVVSDMRMPEIRGLNSYAK